MKKDMNINLSEREIRIILKYIKYCGDNELYCKLWRSLNNKTKV